MSFETLMVKIIYLFAHNKNVYAILIHTQYYILFGFLPVNTYMYTISKKIFITCLTLP